MPFVYKKFNNQKSKITYLFSLPKQKTKSIKQNRERVSFFTSDKGSITVEAAIVIPLFIIMVSVLLHFIIVVEHQNNTLKNLYDTATITGKGGVHTERLSNIVWLQRDSEELILKTSYRFAIPMLAAKDFGINFKQAIFYREWSGESISKEIENKEKMVYVAENSKVYHTNKECSHLYLKVSGIVMSEVEAMRNKNGGKYRECELCINVKPGKSSTVYIAESGKRYHVKKKCSGLKRTVYEINIDKAGGKKLCSRCAK